MAPEQDQQVGRLAFLKLVVDDLDKSERFFGAAFGLKTRREISGPGFAERVLAFDEQAFSLILFRWQDGRAISIGNGHGPIGLTVDDLDYALSSALIAGAALLRRPVILPTMRIAFIASPDGHEIELLQHIGK